MTSRIPFIRRDPDGTIIDGTANAVAFEEGSGLVLDDFRDLDGNELDLPPGSTFEVNLSGVEGGEQLVGIVGNPPRVPTEWPDPDAPWFGIAGDASCPAGIRPFRPANDAEVRCEKPDAPHALHNGPLRDHAYPGSVTQVEWMDDDRRSFTGDWPGACTRTPGCVLPATHPRRCAT